MSTITSSMGLSGEFALVRRYRLLKITFAVELFLIVVYQVLGESPDWMSYDNFLNLARDEGATVFGLTRYEPGFIILSLILANLIASNLVIYGLIASAALYIKCWIIEHVSLTRSGFLFAAIFYLARFAPLHELTQIRVACASAFLLAAFVLLHQDRRTWGVAACAVALAFHVSAGLIIPFLFIRSWRYRFTVILAGGATIIVAFYGVHAILARYQDSIGLIMTYASVGYGDEPVNPLSSGVLLDGGMILAGLILWNRVSPSMRHIVFIEIIGMAIFYAALDFPVIAHRLREFFSVFWVLFAADGLQRGPVVKGVSFLFVVCNIVLYSYLYFYHNPLFQ